MKTDYQIRRSFDAIANLTEVLEPLLSEEERRYLTEPILRTTQRAFSWAALLKGLVDQHEFPHKTFIPPISLN